MLNTSFPMFVIIMTIQINVQATYMYVKNNLGNKTYIAIHITCYESIEWKSNSKHFFLLTLSCIPDGETRTCLPAYTPGTRTLPCTKAMHGSRGKERLQQHMQKQLLVIKVLSQKQQKCRRSQRTTPKRMTLGRSLQSPPKNVCCSSSS